MCNCVSESVNDIKKTNFFVKMLILSKGDDDNTLLYGFAVPTKQLTYPWKFQHVEKTQQCIWSAVLSSEEIANFSQSLTHTSQIVLGGKELKSQGLIKRPVVLSNDRNNKTDGPVSDFSRVTEYWNTDKKALLCKIEETIDLTGKELFRSIQCLLTWVQKECGIDFSKDAARIGNFEVYDFRTTDNAFDIYIHKECGLKKTSIYKKEPISKDLIVNCVAERHGRSISNQTKRFQRDSQELDFFAEEPMSRVIIQIWEVESGNLIFSKEVSLIMGISLSMNIGSPAYQICDPWSHKLFSSAANRSDIIKKQIETVSKTTRAQIITLNGSEHDSIDTAISNSRTLLSVYQRNRTKGAFIANIQKDGEINSFLKIREYIDLPSVKRVIIADPYFSVISAQKILSRIPRTDIQINIITSLTDTDPDTNKKLDICEKYREFLTNYASILHNNLSILNLKRGKEPVFHDRYLVRFFEDGRIDGFLLSNSFNSMGQFYPFVIAPMEQEVCYEVCDYLENLCDPAVQSKRPAKDRIISEVLCDFRNSNKLMTQVNPEILPIDSWLSSWCSNGTRPSIPSDELTCAINVVWEHWEDNKELTCKMISHLGLTNYPWSAKDLAFEIKRIDGAESGFLKEFVKLSRAKEQQQNYISEGVNSDVYIRFALLSGQAEPSRQGFSKILNEAGHIRYSGDNWLRGGYTLLLCLNQSTFIELLDEIKSPLMLDVLASHMLFYPWNEEIFNAAVNCNNLCVRLLCCDYLFYQFQENNLNTAQIENVISKLPPESSGFQISRFLSQLVFHVRATHSIKTSEDEINSIYVWMMNKLAIDLSYCNKEIQKLVLYWLDDCEIHSKCRLHMDLAAMECEPNVRKKIYNEVIVAIEHSLTETTHSGDIAQLIDVYLQALDAMYGDKSEKELLGRIINWRVFETATEPALKNYDYSRWSLANDRAQWQMSILDKYVSLHPSTKAQEWLEYWEPRMRVID